MKKSSLLFALFSFALILPIGVSAMTMKADNSIYVGKDEIVEGNLYAAGSTINIDGTVKGDVICAGQSLNITGKIEGDVICAAQNVNMNGQVGGSFRVAGNTLNVNGAIARSAMLFGAFTNIGNEAKIGWDALIATGNGDLRGQIGGDLHGAGGQILIAGEVAKNISIRMDEGNGMQKKNLGGKSQANLIIAKDAKIGGNVTYTSRQAAQVEDGASIKGELKQNQPAMPIKKGKTALMGGWLLVSLFSALVIGLVIVSLWREPIKHLTDMMLEKIGPAIGWGAVVLFLGPIVLILLLFTLIGVPLAFILFGIWLIAIYISKILVGILIGRSLMNKFWEKRKDSVIIAMIIGIIAAWILCSLPIIGWLLSLIAVLWGLGGIWLYFRKA